VDVLIRFFDFPVDGIISQFLLKLRTQSYKTVFIRNSLFKGRDITRQGSSQ
jgi:hypothetical protein